MRIFREKITREEIDTLCDICGKSTYPEGWGYTNQATLFANWSMRDEDEFTDEYCHMCHACCRQVKKYIVALGGVIREGYG